MSDQTPDSGKDFALDADDESYEGIWSDGTTMWVASRDDGRLYAYDWNNPPTGAPTIIGSGPGGRDADGGHLAPSPTRTGWTTPVFGYQWVSNDGSADTDILDATRFDLHPSSSSDRGMTVKVRVSFTDGAGNRRVA